MLPDENRIALSTETFVSVHMIDAKVVIDRVGEVIEDIIWQKGVFVSAVKYEEAGKFPYRQRDG